METMIIGIAGGTGSGKTTLTLRLKEHFGEDVSILYHDNYYKQHDDMPYEERCRLNYDHPDAFDTELLIADLQALRRGEAVHSPTYDYTVHNRAAETVEVRPARVILVEGILIFVDPGPAGADGHQALCGHRRGCAHPPPHHAGCEKAGALSGLGGAAVPHHRQAHARAVCGAL